MPNEPSEAVQLLTADLFQTLVERARRSARLRTNHNFHGSMEENPHRFLNVMIRGTYIAPHRYLNPAKSESFIVLVGEIVFFTFADDGSVERSERLSSNMNPGIDIQPGVWHTLAVLSDYAVCFEVKPGPYSAANDKDFAPWAPREGDPQTASYLESLLNS